MPVEQTSRAYKKNQGLVDIERIDVALCFHPSTRTVEGVADYVIRWHAQNRVVAFDAQRLAVRGVWDMRGVAVVDLDADSDDGNGDDSPDPLVAGPCPCCPGARVLSEGRGALRYTHDNGVVEVRAAADTSVVRIRWSVPKEAQTLVWHDDSYGDAYLAHYLDGDQPKPFACGLMPVVEVAQPLLDWRVTLCVPRGWTGWAFNESPEQAGEVQGRRGDARRQFRYAMWRHNVENIIVCVGRGLRRTRLLSRHAEGLPPVYVWWSEHVIGSPQLPPMEELMGKVLLGLDCLFNPLADDPRPGVLFRGFTIFVVPQRWEHSALSVSAGCLVNADLLLRGTGAAQDCGRILAHEMSHYVFGHKVRTQGDPEDLWLHEGCATYCESRVHQLAGGQKEDQALKELIVHGLWYQQEWASGYRNVYAQGFMFLLYIVLRLGGPMQFDGLLAAWARWASAMPYVTTEIFVKFVAVWVCKVDPREIVVDACGCVDVNQMVEKYRRALKPRVECMLRLVRGNDLGLVYEVSRSGFARLPDVATRAKWLPSLPGEVWLIGDGRRDTFRDGVGVLPELDESEAAAAKEVEVGFLTGVVPPWWDKLSHVHDRVLEELRRLRIGNTYDDPKQRWRAAFTGLRLPARVQMWAVLMASYGADTGGALGSQLTLEQLQKAMRASIPEAFPTDPEPPFTPYVSVALERSFFLLIVRRREGRLYDVLVRYALHRCDSATVDELYEYGGDFEWYFAARLGREMLGRVVGAGPKANIMEVQRRWGTQARKGHKAAENDTSFHTRLAALFPGERPAKRQKIAPEAEVIEIL